MICPGLVSFGLLIVSWRMQKPDNLQKNDGWLLVGAAWIIALGMWTALQTAMLLRGIDA